MSLSAETIRKAVIAIAPEKAIEWKYGARVARKLHGISRPAIRARAPMNRMFIDNTQIDTFVLVETEYGTMIKRPYITACVEDNTTMCPGFALSFRAPKTNEVLAALRHAILPKTYTQRWVGKSLKLVWEAMGIPREIVVDNGLDLQANSFYASCLLLGIDINTAPPMEPKRKAVMERFFGTLNTKLFHRLAGTTLGRTDNGKKYEYSPKDFACVTLDELVEALHIVLEEMWCTENERTGVIPLRRWRAGIKRFPLRMPENLEEFNAQVNVRATRVIGRAGIEYNGLFYADERLVELARKLGQKPSVTIFIHPEDLRVIYVLDESTQTTIPVSCSKHFDEPYPLFLHEANKKSNADLKSNVLAINPEDADALDDVGMRPEDSDFRLERLSEINRNSRKRLSPDTHPDNDAQLAILRMRKDMEQRGKAPDSEAASVSLGLHILGLGQKSKSPVPDLPGDGVKE